MISQIFHLTFLTILCQLLHHSCAEPPVLPNQGYTAPFANNGGGGGYPSGPAAAPGGGGYNSNAAAYNAALDFNSNNQIGDGGGGGYNGGQGGGHAPPLTSYGTPSYDQAQGGHGHNHEEYGEPKAYEFGYQVKDDYTGTNYNRQEKSDGNQVTGSYRVALPDGRTQIVTYYADWQTGFHADVRYEGEAHYPETYNTNNNNNNRGGYNYPNNNNNNNNNNNGGYNHQQQQPSQDYGVPSNSINNNNNYNDNTAYNNNYNNDRFDSYSNNGFGNKVRPNQEYGAP